MKLSGKKTTALEAHLAKVAGAKTDPKRIALLMGVVLGIVLALWSVLQIVGAGRVALARGMLDGARAALSEAVSAQGAELMRQTEQLALSTAATQQLEQPSAATMRSLRDEAEARLGGVSEVYVVGADVDDLLVRPIEGLTFAPLDMLVEARKSGRVVPVEIHPVDGQLRTTIVAPIKGDGGPRGFILVRRDASQITQIVTGAALAGGYLGLRQGGRVIAEVGDRSLAGLAFAQSEPIPNTRFLVAWAEATPLMPITSESVAVSITMLVIGLLIAAGCGYGIFTYGRPPRVSAKSQEPTLGALVGAAANAPAAAAARSDFREVARASSVEVEEIDELPPPKPPAGPPVKSTARPPVEFDASIFRAYDVRGVVGRQLTPAVVEALGAAVGSEAARRGVAEIVVGRDGRLSGQQMQQALMHGLASTGMRVIDLGMVPTPVVYFACHELGTQSGISVTGSHNPPDYNGFKIVLGGETLASEQIQDLARRIRESDLVQGAGAIRQHEGILDAYLDRIADDVQVEESLKVVVDCGNGVAGVIGPKVIEAIGCEAIPLYAEVDGSFPNHHPDPSELKNLKALIARVAETQADLGIAFDGDGDRLGVVTREGEVVFPDRLLMLFAQDVLTRNPGAAVIYDVKCTGQLSSVVLAHGGSPIMWKTGHSLIKAKMKETMAELAGEMSGHFFFQERWYGFDDGIYAAARLLEIISASGQSATEVLGALPNSVSTPELKVPMNEGEHHAYIAQFREQAKFDGARISLIDGLRADWDDGWGLVRASNTTPVLVLRFDAQSQAALNRIQATFRQQLLAVRGDLKLSF